jgi:uncharacterized membrane protein
MPRFPSVDILRAVAILLMVQVHFVENLSSSEKPSAWLYTACTRLGSLPAPFFTIVSGLSFCLWARKQEALGLKAEAITKVAVRRGLFLFAAGIVFNVVVWFPQGTFNWDILTLIGTSMVILAFARHLPPVILALICVMVLLLSPPLRVVGDFPAYWEDQSYSSDFTFRDIVSGFLVNGYFPVFPWIVFPLIGFIIGDVGFRRRQRSAAWLGQLMAIGIGRMAIAALGIILGAKMPRLIAEYYTNGFTFFPASTEYILGTAGLTMVCVALLYQCLDLSNRNPRIGPVMRFFQRWSTFSLTIYIVHHVVHLWPLWLYGVWMGKDDPTFYWRHAMNTPTALGLALAFVIVCNFALIFLERHKRLSFEWLMRRVCG